MQIKRKNWSLIVGISIPILMILFVWISIYLPSLFSHPTYDFIYSIGVDYSQGQYSVNNNHVVKLPPPNNTGNFVVPLQEANLYYYSAVQGKSRQISLQEAQNYTLNTDITSPDGYQVISNVQGNYTGGFFLAALATTILYI
jgi:hypothetical protein